MSQVPSDLKYTQSHEWLKLQSDGLIQVGITDYAQEQLGDLVFFELPEIGRQLAAGEECAVVESVKTASDIYSPIAGEVVAINDALEDNPELTNDDTYGDGWLLQIKPDNAADADNFLDADAYKSHIET